MVLVIILIIGLAMFIVPVLILLVKAIIAISEESPLVGIMTLGLILIFVGIWFLPT